MPAPDPSLLIAALYGYEYRLTQLDDQIRALRQELAAREAGPTATASRGKSSFSKVAAPMAGGRRSTRRMSAAGRARIARAARKRWREAKRRGINPITGKRLHPTK